jgi:hypothetical protein
MRRAILILLCANLCYGQVAISGRRRITASTGGGPIALIAHTLLDTNNTYPATSSAINCTGANFVAVGIDNYNAPVSGMSISDSQSHSFSFSPDYTSIADPEVGIAYVGNISGASSYTVTVNSGSGAAYATVFVACFSNVATSSIIDQHNGQYNVSAITIQPGSVLPGANNELILTLLGDNNMGNTYSIDSSFTITDQQSHQPNSFGGAFAYLVQTTAASVDPTWASVASTVMHCQATIVTFK